MPPEMMKHENAHKIPMPLAGLQLNGLPLAATPTTKRKLWRNRSVSEAPSSMPRSPITKAFDFLPWTRKKSAEKGPHMPINGGPLAEIQPITGHLTNKDTQDERKDALHRNIFRSGGDILRDILSDKLNKDKVNSGNIKNNNNNNNNIGNDSTKAQLPHKKSNQRRPKQVVARNQSVDIHELFDRVERELKMDKKHNGRTCFLDDTFIENIMKAKEQELQQDLMAAEEAYEAAEYMYENENEADCYRQQQPQQNNQRLNGSGNPSPKHILFNDENVVHLIKKELPVKREAARTRTSSEGCKISRKLSPGSTANVANSHGPHSNTNSNINSNTNNSNSSKNFNSSTYDEKRRSERGESVLRARLRFKKLTPEATPSPLSEQRAAQVLNNSQVVSLNAAGGVGSRHQLIPKAAADKAGGLAGSPSAAGSVSKRSILQRQNTSPATSCSGLTTSPELRRREQTECFQHVEQHTQRRKSLADSSYESTLQYDNSSSSSMGSGGMSVGCGGGSMGGIMNERARGEKPRKKLSFREPVVSGKDRTRRLSSPSQRRSGMDFGVVAAGTAGLEAFKNNGNCDNFGKIYDNRHATEKASPCGSYTEHNNDAESQAMRIVRTVGQAFDVCHKFNFTPDSPDHHDERSDISSGLLDVAHTTKEQQLQQQQQEQQFSDEDIKSAKKDQVATPILQPDTNANPQQRPKRLEIVPTTLLNSNGKYAGNNTQEDKSPQSPNSEINKLKDQLEQQALQTRQALAQLMVVREQLLSETNARIEAQTRTQQLLQQNRELLEHLASLGSYTDQTPAGLTSANIAMAPQTHLQLWLQALNNQKHVAAINQQMYSLGSVNQQLSSLSQQLNGLNQHSQTLQSIAGAQQMQPPQSQSPPQAQLQSQALSAPIPGGNSQLHLNVSAANTASGTGSTCTLASSPYPSMSQLQNIGCQLQQLSATDGANQQHQDALSKELFQANEDLLNRLQALNLGASTSAVLKQQQTPSPNNSFFYVNPMSGSPSNASNYNNNNNNSIANFLSSPSSLGNLTPSPMGTLNRSSPLNEDMRLSMDKNINSIDGSLGHMLAAAAAAAAQAAASSNGNIASTSGTRENSRSSSTIDSPTSPNIRHNYNNNNSSSQYNLSQHHNNNNNNNNNNDMRYNTVMLRVTDEAGNLTSQRKISATPSFITRSTSEKVPNRSQLMSQVHRSAWARHTTK